MVLLYQFTTTRRTFVKCEKRNLEAISLDPKIYLPETGTSSEKFEYAGDGIDSELKSLHLNKVATNLNCFVTIMTNPIYCVIL